jgi:hypothetical protein
VVPVGGTPIVPRSSCKILHVLSKMMEGESANSSGPSRALCRQSS